MLPGFAAVLACALPAIADHYARHGVVP